MKNRTCVVSLHALLRNLADPVPLFHILGYGSLELFARKSRSALRKLRRLLDYSCRYAIHLYRLAEQAVKGSCDGHALDCLCGECLSHRGRIRRAYATFAAELPEPVQRFLLRHACSEEAFAMKMALSCCSSGH